jgi:hypothetical protein
MAGAIALIGAAMVALLPGPTASAKENVEAMTYLTRIAQAQGSTYSCRQLVAYFGKARSAAAVLDIRSSGGGQYVRAESGSGVTRLWRGRDSSVLSASATDVQESATATVSLKPDQVIEKYDVAVGEPSQMFGVDVVPLTLTRRRDRTTVEKWLVQAASGIVYRRELFDAQSKLVGMATITDMKWGGAAADSPEPREPSTEPPHEVKAASKKGAPKMLPSGYRLLRAYTFEADGRPAQQFVYSDGLHALSVFATKGSLSTPEGFERADIGEVEGWVGPGPGTWAWEGDGRNWMIVAEEPALDPVELTNAFPRGGRSFWAGLGALWSRLFDAMGNLFD